MKDDEKTDLVDDAVKDDIEKNGLSLASNPSNPPLSPSQTAPPSGTGGDTTAADQPDKSESQILDEIAGAASSGDSANKHQPHAGDTTLDPIKKQALSKLEPLLDELDLSPEEEFRTLLMIIQTTDNKKYIKRAYELADKIKDKKIRAQALLSVVNEIEYFSSKEVDKIS